MTNKELAVLITRAIFACGDERDDKTQRIQFKGGHWPDAETNLGGFNEPALAAFVEKVLSKVERS